MERKKNKTKRIQDIKKQEFKHTIFTPKVYSSICLFLRLQISIMHTTFRDI